TKHAALGVFDYGIHDVGVAAIYVNAYTAGDSVGKVFCQLVPRCAAVDSFVESAPGSAPVKAPGSSSSLICGSIENPGALGIHGDIGYAGIFIDEQRL